MNRRIESECHHKDVLVDYEHPLGCFKGQFRVADLQAFDPSRTRPFMTLENPRCAKCGVSLHFKNIRNRIFEGGDLYDKRFLWPDLPLWWRIKRAWQIELFCGGEGVNGG
jgi:hypothetical protein